MFVFANTHRKKRERSLPPPPRSLLHSIFRMLHDDKSSAGKKGKSGREAFLRTEKKNFFLPAGRLILYKICMGFYLSYFQKDKNKGMTHFYIFVKKPRF